MNIRPKKIVITSQYEISEIWEDPQTVEALERRCVKKVFPVKETIMTQVVAVSKKRKAPRTEGTEKSSSSSSTGSSSFKSYQQMQDEEYEKEQNALMEEYGCPR